MSKNKTSIRFLVLCLFFLLPFSFCFGQLVIPTFKVEDPACFHKSMTPLIMDTDQKLVAHDPSVITHPVSKLLATKNPIAHKVVEPRHSSMGG